ncbi:RES family NAD+ phosphorylase [Filibacter tadaridae]|uniref:RES domain protein n=1 Tax=Filibacter tadaridae TaxID=2483811 RepID=A0A3P5X3Q6_9BACL|nr:RES family NAD+ phosphorylase [Filibacter tadaridae]VDC25146.1 RES domain protein [Filibacter tadaridae]
MYMDNKLEKTLKKIQPIPFTKTMYRNSDIKYLLLGDNPLSGEGAKFADGRFHLKSHGISCYYASEDMYTSLDETYPPRDQNHPPRVFISLVIQLGSVLDLCNESNWDILQTSYQELTGNWKNHLNQTPAPTQLLGKATYDSQRFEAIQFYTAKGEPKRNIVIFPDLLKKGSFVNVYDPDGGIDKILKGVYK